MSINAISQANGADLLNLYSQSVGQSATPAAEAASVKALKAAITQAKLSESEILGGGNGASGSQINLFA
jgi:hypothetical protein